MDLDDGLTVHDEGVRKILIIGPKRAGKTSYISQYVSGYFSTQDGYKQTIGVDFSMKTILCNGQPFKLQFWDIAGQERTRQMTRDYYRDAHACIVMFDMTNARSLGECSYWKRDLDDKCRLLDGSPIPCLLLANKSDLANQRAFSKDAIQQFANDHSFVHHMETSVKNNANIEQSMETLIKLLFEKSSLLPHHKQQGIKLDTSAPKREIAREKKPCC